MGLLRAVKNLDGASSYGFPRVPWSASVGEWLEGGGRRGINQGNALTLPAFWAGVRALSEDIASLPFIVYRETDKNKERAKDSPWYEVLHDFANPETTAFQWRETGMAHLNTWGNFFSEITYDRAGRPQLWIIKPERMEVRWDAQGHKAYTYLSPTEGRKELKPDSVFHVPGLGYDGLVGYSPVTMFRAALSEGQTAIDMARNFWGRGARPSVILTVPAGYPEVAKVNLKAAWSKHEGSENAGRTAMLEDGVTATPLSMNFDDAQFLETRKYHNIIVAQILRIPPDKLADLERATFSNIDQQDINYAKYSILPWCHRIEGEVKRQLLREDTGLYAEFLLDGLLRGDPLARAQALQIRLRNGTLTPDEWRAKENDNPYDPGVGDHPFFAADLVPAQATTDQVALATKNHLANEAAIAASRNGRHPTEATTP